MNEVAWCYLEGFGTKKDKVSRPPSRLALPAVRHHSARPSHSGTLPRATQQRAKKTRTDRAIREPLLNPDGTAVRVGHQRPPLPSDESQPPSPSLPPSHAIRLTDAQQHQQYTAAKYYRLAEKNGNKIIGNPW